VGVVAGDEGNMWRKSDLHPNARPIPLPRDYLRSVSVEIQEVIRRAVAGKVGPLGKRQLFVSDGPALEVPTVAGFSVPVWVGIVSEPTRAVPYVFRGAVGTTKDRTKRVLMLYLNGSIDAEVIYKSASGSGLIAKQTYEVLLHEATHIADVFQGGVDEAGTGAEALMQDLHSYYNHKSEVAAYLQEVVDELRPFYANYPKLAALFGPAKGLDVLLGLSTTWQAVSPYWNDRNRARVIRAVAREAQGG
jgi:hypothetical protein